MRPSRVIRMLHPVFRSRCTITGGMCWRQSLAHLHSHIEELARGIDRCDRYTFDELHDPRSRDLRRTTGRYSDGLEPRPRELHD